MKNYRLDNSRIVLEIKTSRTEEETPEAMIQFFASIVNLKRRFLLLFRRAIPLSFEIGVYDQAIHFFLVVPKKYQSFIESQIVSQYPKALIMPVKDLLPQVIEDKRSAVGQLKLGHGSLYPLKTYQNFKDIDPLSSLLGILSKAGKNDVLWIQFLLVQTNSKWQRKGEALIQQREKDPTTGALRSNPYSKVIGEKIAFHGFKTAIRLAAMSTSINASRQWLFEISNAFAAFNNPTGNSLGFHRPVLWQPYRLAQVMKSRSRHFMPRQILNIAELATIYHFPTKKLATIHNISWYKTILSEPPENLPIADGLSDEEKKQVNFFARTQYKNNLATFGIRAEDRRKHMYIIGKTGTGKSTLVANMVISDIRNGKGVCVIDPHGDLCETILQYIPSYRLNDIVYLDPSDKEYPFALNPLEVQNFEQKELVVSGIVAIFRKMYEHSWGPRLEYILRNVLLSVIDLPNATLLYVPAMLTDEEFRKKALEVMQDQVMKNFWINEFENMHPRLKSEAISPILNKVGQFVSSPLMRNIIKSSKSTVDLEKIMNEGKILLLNLSQGKLGEDNAALLGAMTITKLQLAAMNRVSVPEAQRRDFYLYVDEFQNFATTSFIKILSEARKYRLNLILANQYIAQIPEDVRAAIFGNAGTMMSFIVGAEDNRYLAREFGERFTEEDLLALGNYQAIIKLAIEGITRSPFLAHTLPLPQSKTNNKEKAIHISRERYAKK